MWRLPRLLELGAALLPSNHLALGPRWQGWFLRCPARVSCGSFSLMSSRISCVSCLMPFVSLVSCLFCVSSCLFMSLHVSYLLCFSSLTSRLLFFIFGVSCFLRLMSTCIGCSRKFVECIGLPLYRLLLLLRCRFAGVCPSGHNRIDRLLENFSAVSLFSMSLDTAVYDVDQMVLSDPS